MIKKLKIGLSKRKGKKIKTFKIEIYKQDKQKLIKKIHTTELNKTKLIFKANETNKSR